MKYLGPRANKALAYGVASVSGTILAVCSCTVLPLFAGIWRLGAGLGPATAFLYSGPAINVLAIVLTARVLGPQLGIARAVGAIVFSVVIGVLMHLIYRKEEAAKVEAQMFQPEPEVKRPLWQSATFLAVMIPFAAGVVGLSAVTGTDRGEAGDWFSATWGFAKQILPLLFLGVVIAGFLLGRVGHEGVIPSRYVEMLVGATPDTFLSMTGLAGAGVEPLIRTLWSVWTNFFASVFGAFMYFATLTEVPILQGLIGSGMGKGPALALLLAGPALSLPSMLVLRSIMGLAKTVVYVSLVVVMSTITGMVFGAFAG
jgi:uncharacterized membrane protein YraQ (UPF0718 family)